MQRSLPVAAQRSCRQIPFVCAVCRVRASTGFVRRVHQESKTPHAGPSHSSTLISPAQRRHLFGFNKSSSAKDESRNSPGKTAAVQKDLEDFAARSREQEKPGITAETTKSLESLDVDSLADEEEITEWADLEWVGSKKWARDEEAKQTQLAGLRSAPARSRIESENGNALVADVVRAAYGGEYRKDALLPTDADMKLKLLKTVVDLTGVRFSDFDARRMVTVGDLERLLCRTPRSTAYEAIMNHRGLKQLPNVTLLPRKQSIRRLNDERKGTWSLIEQALRERNLPLTSKDVPRLSKRV